MLPGMSQNKIHYLKQDLECIDRYNILWIDTID
jgi:hypothetical protein